ncbi:hypothetical protein ACJJTC_008400 [Scirpophaga incertulas]
MVGGSAVRGVRGGAAATPPGAPATPEPALHDCWPSVSSVSDNDEVSLCSDYSDTLFNMLLNSLTFENAASEDGRPSTPPVQPWSPAAPGAGAAHGYGGQSHSPAHAPPAPSANHRAPRSPAHNAPSRD